MAVNEFGTMIILPTSGIIQHQLVTIQTHGRNIINSIFSVVMDIEEVSPHDADGYIKDGHAVDRSEADVGVCATAEKKSLNVNNNSRIHKKRKHSSVSQIS